MKFLFLIFLLSGTGLSIIHSQELKQEPSKEALVVPDVFSELDEVPLPKVTKDEKVLKVLEQARQNYLKALILVNKSDTVNSFGYFEESLVTLNTLSDFPNIDKNSDFIDLLSKVVSDYRAVLPDNPQMIKSSIVTVMSEKYLYKQNFVSTNQTKVESLSLQKNDSLNKSGSARNENIIPLEDNEYVQKSIEFLTQNKIGKKFIRNCIERYGRWGSLLSDIINEEGMPQEIIFLSMVESGLNPHAVSRAKAAGLWQFMKTTGLDYGLNENGSVWIDERKDPIKATRASMKHLRDLYTSLGDWYLAMAAYNYGIGGVRKSINKSKLENPTFWELRDYLPKETKNYVPLFIATAKVVMNPKEYGLDISEFNILDEFKYEPYTINEPICVKALAKCAGISVDEFKDYNPELILSCTPPDLKEYTIRLPEGTKSSFIASLSTLTPEEKQPWVTHISSKKETFESIAKIYGVSAEALASANNMKLTKKHLKKGTVLRVPTESIIPADEIAKRIAKSNNNQNDEMEPDLSGFITHTVTSGETPVQIANQYNISLGELKKLNDINDDNAVLENGSVLKIAPKIAEAAKPAVQKIIRPDVIRHTVKENETIESIAEHYSVKPEDINRWNRISGTIRLGQNLKIITSEHYTPSITRYQTEKKNFKKNDETNISDDNSDSFKSRQKSENTQVERKHVQNKQKHKVKRGENLASIADKYGVSINELREWNPKSVKGSKINSGTVLNIYPQGKQKTKVSKESSVTKNKKKKTIKSSKSYTVKKGDNIQTISKKTGVSVSTLKKHNKKLNNKDLKAGQKIKLKK